MLLERSERFPNHKVAAWRNGNVADHINEVAVRHAWLVYWDVHTTLVSLPSHPGQLLSLIHI